MKIQPILYLIAPLTADTPEEVAANIATANKAAKKLFNMGYIVICSHNLYGHWYGEVSETHAMAGCLRLQGLSHLCCTLEGWEKSNGCQTEIINGKINGIPNYFGEDNVPPVEDFEPDTLTCIIDWLFERRRVGMKTYDRPLMPHNGRDSGKDLMEELLDAIMYAFNLKLELSGNSR